MLQGTKCYTIVKAYNISSGLHPLKIRTYRHILYTHTSCIFYIRIHTFSFYRKYLRMYKRYKNNINNITTTRETTKNKLRNRNNNTFNIEVVCVHNTWLNCPGNKISASRFHFSSCSFICKIRIPTKFLLWMWVCMCGCVSINESIDSPQTNWSVPYNAYISTPFALDWILVSPREQRWQTKKMKNTIPTVQVY